MPAIDLPLDPAGQPIVSVGVFLSLHRLHAMQAANLPLPKPFLGLGLIDTGASGTAIDTAVIAGLGLIPTGSTKVYTPSTGSTPHICSCYDVSFWFFSQPPASAQPPPPSQPSSKVHLIHPNHMTLPVMESRLINQGFHALIGRDILAHCHLAYDGKNKKFTLAFDP